MPCTPNRAWLTEGAWLTCSSENYREPEPSGAAWWLPPRVTYSPRVSQGLVQFGLEPLTPWSCHVNPDTAPLTFDSLLFWSSMTRISSSSFLILASAVTFSSCSFCLAASSSSSCSSRSFGGREKNHKPHSQRGSSLGAWGPTRAEAGPQGSCALEIKGLGNHWPHGASVSPSIKWGESIPWWFQNVSVNSLVPLPSRSRG